MLSLNEFRPITGLMSSGDMLRLLLIEFSGDPLAEPSAILRPRVEMDFGAGWVDVSLDVVGSVKADWGIHSDSPKDRVADPGDMNFSLDNSKANSGGKRGYYSPGHPDARAGFKSGAKARLVLNHALYGDRVMWVGTVRGIRPNVGAKAPSTHVSCVDWMEEASRAKLSGVAVQVDKQSDLIFNTIVAAVERQPPGGVLVAAAGSDIYPFALDNSKDEKSKVTDELDKLARSEFGYAYVFAGQLIFEGRRRRGGSGGVRFSMSDDAEILSLGVTEDRDDIINRALVSIHPRRVDTAATTVLFNLGSAIEIKRGTSVRINCPYRDPNQQAQRVGGKDMVTPVAGTDYLFTMNKDGTGADIKAQLTVAATFGGNSAQVTVTNNGPADGWIPANGLKLRGRGLYDFESVFADKDDATSLAAYGENVFTYDMPYQVSPENAIDLASFIVALYKDARVRATKVTFAANWSDAVAEQAFNLGISDKIAITAPSVGMSGQVYFVNGVSLEVRQSGLVLVTWDVVRADTTQFWVLEVPGRTELDQTTVLGYGLFVAGWILDTSQLGTNTFVN